MNIRYKLYNFKYTIIHNCTNLPKNNVPTCEVDLFKLPKTLF